ncbi:MAG: NBR1-Ig-like domain-containing protein [Thermoflexales bacterium]
MRREILGIAALALLLAGCPAQAGPGTPTVAAAAPCPIATQTPAFLVVDPVTTPTGGLESDISIRIASVQGGPGRAIQKGADAGANGTLLIETASGAFGVSKIKLLPDTSHRLTISVEYDETSNSGARDTAGNCATQVNRRKLSANTDQNGTPLVIVQSQALAGAGSGSSPVSGPTITPSAPPTVVPANTAACADAAAFVSDVTIPDGSDVGASTPFNKVWRVRNAGVCAWTTGYGLVRTSTSAGFSAAEGTALSAVVNPGDSADVSIALTSPAAGGSYQAAYRLRAPDGTPFGPSLTVAYNVPGVVAPSGCSGTPAIASFVAPRLNPTSNQFTLQWGAVTNADRVEIDNGIGPVASPGERSVTIAANKTFRITAKCGATTANREVALTYIAPVAIVSFAGNWVHNFGTMNLTQSGTSVTGSYVNSFSGGNGTVQGTVSGNTLNGTYTIGGGSGSIQWTINGNTLDGNWGGSSQWCGARSGNAFPNGCGFAGSWVASVAGNTACAMTLTQNGTTVSGSYCNGSLSGSVSYASSGAILTGNWTTGGTGTLKFYLATYNGDTFQGNWNTSNAWCGRRSGATLPGTCLR